MYITSYSEFRRQIKYYLDKVVKTKKPLSITCRGGNDLVLMSKDEYTAMEETLYLLSSPKNSERLIESIVKLKSS